MGRTKSLLAAAALLGVVLGSAWAFETPRREWREYPGQDNVEVPPDFREPAEWVFARLMYPPASGRFGRRSFRGSSWKNGYSSWTTDYSAADRHVARALRRLTRVHVRSVEQPVDLDDGDDVFNYPWLYAVEVGQWELTDRQAKQMREYLERGGFFMTDDFHGTAEWAQFMESMQRVFPDRPVVDIPPTDSIFHVLYDLSDKYQVPGAQYLSTGRTFERDGYQARWRGIYDNSGRLMVAICHNMDLGDAWEYADEPSYDEKFSALAFRIAANYAVYSMTH